MQDCSGSFQPIRFVWGIPWLNVIDALPRAIRCCWCLAGLWRLVALLQGSLGSGEKVKSKGLLSRELGCMVCEACVVSFAILIAPETSRNHDMTLGQICAQATLWAVLACIYARADSTPATPACQLKAVPSCTPLPGDKAADVWESFVPLSPHGLLGHIQQQAEVQQLGSEQVVQRATTAPSTTDWSHISVVPSLHASDQGWSSTPLALASHAQLQLEQHASSAVAAAQQLQGLIVSHRPNQYAAQLRHASVYMKIPWAEPEDLAVGWQETMQQHVLERTQGRVRVAHTSVRRGCIELAIDLVHTDPHAATGGAAGGSDIHPEQDALVEKHERAPGWGVQGRSQVAQIAGGALVDWTSSRAGQALQQGQAASSLCASAEQSGAAAGAWSEPRSGRGFGAAAGAAGLDAWENELISELPPQDWVHWLYLQPPKDAEVLVQACGRAFVTSWDGAQWATRELPHGLGPDGQPLPPVLPKITSVSPACFLVPAHEPLLMLTPVEQEPRSASECGSCSLPAGTLATSLSGPLLDQPGVRITARFHGRYLPVEPAPLPPTHCNSSPCSCSFPGSSAAPGTMAGAMSLHAASGPVAPVTLPFLVRGVDQPGMLLLECWYGRLLTSRKQLVVVDEPQVAAELEAYYKQQAAEVASSEADEGQVVAGASGAVEPAAAGHGQVAASSGGPGVGANSLGTESAGALVEQANGRSSSDGGEAGHATGRSSALLGTASSRAQATGAPQANVGADSHVNTTMSSVQYVQQMSGNDRSSDDLMCDLGCWVEYMVAMQQMQVLHGRSSTPGQLHGVSAECPEGSYHGSSAMHSKPNSADGTPKSMIAAAAVFGRAAVAPAAPLQNVGIRGGTVSAQRPSSLDVGMDGVAAVVDPLQDSLPNGNGFYNIPLLVGLARASVASATQLSGGNRSVPSSCPASKRLHSPATLSSQLLHAAQQPAYQGQMQEVGIQLLEHCCSCAWLATAEMILADLLSLGIPFSSVKQEATTAGMTLLHRAVCSGSQRMVQAVVRWGLENGDPWNWSEADPSNGITPLHVAAVVPSVHVRMQQSRVQKEDDKGTLADWILQEYEAAWQYWHGATDVTGSTPADIAEAHAGAGGLPATSLHSEGFLAAVVATGGNLSSLHAAGSLEEAGLLPDAELLTVDGGFGSELTTFAVTMASHEVMPLGDRLIWEYAQDLAPGATRARGMWRGAGEGVGAAARLGAVGRQSGRSNSSGEAACPGHLLGSEGYQVAQQQWEQGVGLGAGRVAHRAVPVPQEGPPSGHLVPETGEDVCAAQPWLGRPGSLHSSQTPGPAEADVAGMQQGHQVDRGWSCVGARSSDAALDVPVAELLAERFDPRDVVPGDAVGTGFGAAGTAGTGVADMGADPTATAGSAPLRNAAAGAAAETGQQEASRFRSAGSSHTQGSQDRPHMEASMQLHGSLSTTGLLAPAAQGPTYHAHPRPPRHPVAQSELRQRSSLAVQRADGLPGARPPLHRASSVGPAALHAASSSGDVPAVSALEQALGSCHRPSQPGMDTAGVLAALGSEMDTTGIGLDPDWALQDIDQQRDAQEAGQEDGGPLSPSSDPTSLLVLLRATLLLFPSPADEESYCVWVAQHRAHLAQLVQILVTITLCVALGYELGSAGVRGCVTLLAYAAPWGAMWAVRRQLADNSWVQARLLAEPVSVMVLLWGVGVRAFQAAGLLPAPYTLVGLLPLGGDTVLELVVHTSLQVRLPNLLLPRCLYILASAALYIRLGVAASTAHAVAVVGMYNMVGILICALLDFKNRCAWATVHGVPGMPAAVRPATSTATTRQ